MKVVISKDFLKHNENSHLENKNRILAIYEVIKDKKEILEDPYEVEETEAKKLLQKIHDINYINRIFELMYKSKSENRVLWIDSDTYVSPGTFDSVLACIGSILKAKDLIDEENYIFCAVRPPGHHSGIRGRANAISQGFCLFNNIALLREILNEKVIILDIDLHHGNGTEEIVKSKKDTLFVSLHASGIYPGTGYESYNNIYNFPLDFYTSDKEYIGIFKSKVVPLIDNFNPDVILVSLGWDAHKSDPLSVLYISFESYKKVFEFLKHYRVVFVLEGGYNLNIIKSGTKLLVTIFC